MIPYEPPLTTTRALPNALVLEVTDAAYWQAVKPDDVEELETADGGRMFVIYCDCIAGPHRSIWIDASTREEGIDHRGTEQERDQARGGVRRDEPPARSAPEGLQAPAR